MTDATILRRLFQTDHPVFTRAATEAFASFELPDREKARLRDLAAKARAGTLSAAEHQEVEAYGRVGSFLSILRAQARKLLAENKRTGRR